MTCLDTVGQIVQEALSDKEVYSFTVDQHWPNGNVGSASSWLTLLQGGDYWFLRGQASFSYDPHNHGAFILDIVPAVGELLFGYPTASPSAFSSHLLLDPPTTCSGGGSAPLHIDGKEDAGQQVPAADMPTLTSVKIRPVLAWRRLEHGWFHPGAQQQASVQAAD